MSGYHKNLKSQQRATVLATIGFIGGALALLSMVAYGVFEWRWWTQLDDRNEMPRGLIIFLLHIGLFAGGVVSTIYLLSEWVHND